MRALQKLALAAVCFGGLSLAGGAVQASDCYTPKCYYKTVIAYETVQKPCIHWVVKYDHCGKAYREKVVTYKTVKVLFEKVVKVCY